MSKITTPDNKSISYTYNSGGYMTGVTDYSGYEYTYSYGGTGDITSIAQRRGTSTLRTLTMLHTYPGLIKERYIHEAGSGGSIQEEFFSYNDAGRVTRINKDIIGETGVVYDHTNSYTYDLAGNIIRETATGDGTTSYEYDALNRIIDEVSSTGSTAYTYDANNNIIQKVITENGVRTTKHYVYNAANRITDYNERDATGNTTYASVFYYDANGNMTQRYSSDFSNIYYSYDAWNRLTKYTAKDGTQTTYTYNGDNRRTSKTTGDVTTNYYWDRDYVSMETVGTTTNTNLVTPGGIMGRITNDKFNFLIKDAHGDVIATVESGETNTYSYDAFGIEKTPDSADTNPIRYAGEYYDSESGLIYLRNRYYDPEMGRFINEDPIEDGLNWYAYCGNNPLTYLDPTGLEYTVVSGGNYGETQGYEYNFIEPAIKKIIELRESNSSESISWCIANAGWSENDWRNFQNAVIGLNVDIIVINDAQELVNYINYKNTDGLSVNMYGDTINERTGDEISKFIVFSHGIQNIVALGYDYTSNYNQKLNLSKGDISKIKPEAFDNPNSWFYSCNTANGENSFLKIWHDKVGGFSGGYEGFTSYYNIMGLEGYSSFKISMWKQNITVKNMRKEYGFSATGSINYPTAYVGARQVTY